MTDLITLTEPLSELVRCCVHPCGRLAHAVVGDVGFCRKHRHLRGELGAWESEYVIGGRSLARLLADKLANEYDQLRAELLLIADKELPGETDAAEHEEGNE